MLISFNYFISAAGGNRKLAGINQMKFSINFRLYDFLGSKMVGDTIGSGVYNSCFPQSVTLTGASMDVPADYQARLF
jgi:hypothetical protein